MKYQQGKIKREHGVLKKFEKFLFAIAKITEIIRIIPGRIHSTSGSSSHTGVSFSYSTKSGLKYKLNTTGTSQECFVVCNPDNTTVVKQQIAAIKH